VSANIAAVIAAWMFEKVRTDGVLYQAAAAAEIQAKYGDSFAFYSESGGLLISPAVLRSFERISKGVVKYVRPQKYWRLAQEGDPPGRQVDF
jgi:hypothetical protein